MSLLSKESIDVEFKSERSKPTADSVIVNTVVAFANTRGGTLYLGVEDDGTPTGVSPEHRNLNQLAAYVFNNTVPPLQIRSSIIDVNGTPVAAITVDESSQLVCAKSGRVLHRVLKANGEPENITMYPTEFISRLSTIGQYDYSDQPAPESSLEDLDPQARNQLRAEIAQTHADDQLLALTDEEFDGALGLTTRSTPSGRPQPTIAGILLIGTEAALRLRVPTAATTFQVMRAGSPVVGELLRLPLVSLFRRIEDLITPWNTATELMSGARHAIFYAYDRSALREAIVNALCHRDYAVMASISIQIDEAGLTIASPGGFVRGVTYGNLLTVPSTPRNRRLADILKRCGYAERTGRGIDRIYERTVASGRPLPDYSQSTGERVVLFLRNMPVDERFVLTIDEMTARREAPLATASLDRSRVTLAADELLADGAIEHHKRNGTYAIAPRYQSAQNQESLRLSADNVLSHMRETGGPVTVSQIAQHFDASYSTASRLLKRMQSEGLIRHRGRTRKSVYLPHEQA